MLLTTVLVLYSTLATASPHSKRATTLIPRTVFDSTANLEQYFTYNYPWGGDTHNGIFIPYSSILSVPSAQLTNTSGGARMDKAHVTIPTPGTLTITAQPVKG